MVALMLLTKWNGRTTVFGNDKWGYADTHPDYKAKTYWDKFFWLVWRNPVYNLNSRYLAAPMSEYKFKGDDPIGDKVAGGRYFIRMRNFWEYYLIVPYTIFNNRRCVRLRAGWKINDNGDDTASFVFTINPFKAYKGI